MREIVLDTETTGLSPNAGDKILEIGCVELINGVPSGAVFHQYINPGRDVPEEAFAIHGLSEEFLSDKPMFSEIVDTFLEFLGEAHLIIHNAEFDIGFLNAELELVNRPRIPMSRTTDTIRLARQKFPGSPASLDALCKKFKIDCSNRKLHGALLDSQLLAEVYQELSGGRQGGLTFETTKNLADDAEVPRKHIRRPRAAPADPEELAAHSVFIGRFKKSLWNQP